MYITRICQFNRDDKRPWYIEISKIPGYDAEKSAFERQRQEKKYLAEHNEQRLKIFHFFLISHTYTGRKGVKSHDTGASNL